jgi:CRISPR-associated protein Cas1
MIKRTLYFGNPAYLSVKDEQLQVKLPEVEKNENLSLGFKKEAAASIPLEDIGMIVLDNYQITCTHQVFEELLNNNAAIIICNAKHHPEGLLLPLDGNTIQSERFQYQIEATAPLKKQLWQQTIEIKIRNQAAVLKKKREINIQNMLHWADSVKSGDTQNHEARAAAYYWQNMFPETENFTRSRDGDYPNNLLNYGYAILRACMARALVSSGMLPTLGIHHHNRYNAYCLADDMMEPYRPYIDLIVCEIMEEFPAEKEITKEIKVKLLQIPVMDIIIGGQKSPLMVGISQTTASLQKCYEGSLRKVVYPEL